MPDKPNIAVEYDYLLELEDLGRAHFVPPGAGKRYSVSELLNGVDSTSYRNNRLKRNQEEEKLMGHKHVFVSYLHDNKDEVERLVSELESAGEGVWWDENILGGSDWKKKFARR